jgi:hypothetical protein
LGVRGLLNVTEFTERPTREADKQPNAGREVVTLVTESIDALATDASGSYAAAVQMSKEVDELINLLSQFHTGSVHSIQLRRAMVAHLSWKAKLRGFLNGKGTWGHRVAFGHTACGFGKCYTEVGKVLFDDVSEIQQIERPHRQLHELIRRISELKERGDMQVAESEYERIGPISEKIVEIMQKISNR